ncbi:MAG TPA: hypothetical protein PKC95_00125 [Thauera aminoaromatica]|nr:hypothetical protein [Thauera aminoaromatica]
MAEDQQRVMRSERVTDWFEIDHAYWRRFEYHRASHRRLWCDGMGDPDFDRFDRLGVDLRPPYTGGRYVLLALQSQQFYTRWAGMTIRHFLDKVRGQVRKHSRRTLRVRYKPIGHMRRQPPLAEALAEAWIVVTHSSAVALEALASGLPVIVTEKTFCAARLATPWERLENPIRPTREARRELFARIAAHQWTLDEMRSGEAWARLTEHDDRYRRRSDGPGSGPKAPGAGPDRGASPGAALAPALGGFEHCPAG